MKRIILVLLVFMTTVFVIFMLDTGIQEWTGSERFLSSALYGILLIFKIDELLK